MSLIIEPSADQRQAALAIRQMYLALLEQNFSEAQALQIIGYSLAGGGG